jgi:type VI secretion system secreted protein Hcp
MAVPIDQGRKGNVDIFVTLTTDKAGPVKGESTDTDFLGALEITGFSWGMLSPSSASTGQATGRRQHKPLRLYRNIDAATCPLASALSQNQLVKELVLTCRKAGSGGRALKYLVITLKKGRVISLDLEYLDQSGGGSGREVAEISYQEIQIDYTPQSKAGLSDATRSWVDTLIQNA